MTDVFVRGAEALVDCPELEVRFDSFGIDRIAVLSGHLIGAVAGYRRIGFAAHPLFD
jgi:hypothetical protein